MKFTSIILLMHLVCSHTLMAQYTWTQKASMPIARYIGSEVVIDGKAYIGTGYDSIVTALNDWWQYDPVTNSYTQMASMSASRSSAVAFEANGKGYVGLGLSGNQFLTDLHEYNPINNTWTQKSSLPGQGRFGCASFTIDNAGYICCGNFGSATGPYTNEVFAYNSITDTWTLKAPFPGMVRYGGRGEAIDNFGYVFGGINGVGNSSSFFFADLWQYDPTQDTWSQKTDFPGSGRSYSSTFGLDGKFVAGVGIHWSGYFSDFYAYDPVTNNWSSLPSLPPSEARWASVGFSIGNDGYVATGNQSFNNPIVTDNKLWKLSLSTFIQINNESSNTSFEIFPTIVSDHLNIIISSSEINHAFLVITSAKGSVYSNLKIQGTDHKLNTSNLSQGLYFATLMDENNNRISTRKFIVNHK